MTLAEVYADLLRRGVRLFSGSYAFDCGADAVAVKLGDAWGVFLDDRRILTTAEEKVAVTHEWAHIVTNATYGLDAPPALKQMAEMIADRRQIEAVLPWRTLSRDLRRGMQAWEIAEDEGVTEELVRQALTYYTEKRGKTA